MRTEQTYNTDLSSCIKLSFEDEAILISGCPSLPGCIRYKKQHASHPSTYVATVEEELASSAVGAAVASIKYVEEQGFRVIRN